ncbi:MAG: hypothetical protein IE933_14440 [Sphingomonadales bacterium]|nr:hypothetical protein [Sphingomonadales bacterium]
MDLRNQAVNSGAMADPFDTDARRAIRSALARESYRTGSVPIADPQLAGYSWLFASHRGVFAVSETQAKTVLNGWFFGIERVDDTIYLFENCAMRDRSLQMGRIVRFRIVDGRLTDPSVLVTGLASNCHQVRMIDGALCVVDTGNQAIRRYTPEGALIDVLMPFPVAPPSDESGIYRHINSVARVGERIAIMCHNGKCVPEKQSELAWLDGDWNLLSFETIAGHHCHDIVADENGALWHCASAEGDLISSNGRRIHVTDRLMTRALAFSADRAIVGVTTFGPRQLRDTLNGGVAIFDREFRLISQIDLRGSPTDVVAL